LDAGWRIVFLPSVVVHHRLSDVGRRSGRIWAYSLRNNLWTAILRLPASSLPAELTWKLLVGTLEVIRQFQFAWYIWALWSAATGLSRVLRLRRPISKKTWLMYNLLRFGDGASREALIVPRRITLRQRLSWLFATWRHRRRGRAFWDWRPGGVGRSSLAGFSDPRRRD
jgi:GT2 family glycosyltransferase